MAVPDYTKRAINKYNEKFDRIMINLPKGTKEKYKEYNMDISLSKFALNAVIEKLEQLEKQNNEKQ